MSKQAPTLYYTLAASLAAVSLFYVFGPTLLPDREAENGPRTGAVGLSNPANDCFINSVLQALAGSPRLRRYLDDQANITDHSAPAADQGGELRFGHVASVASENADPPADGSIAAVSIVTRALRNMLDRLHDPALNGKTISARAFIRSLESAFRTAMSRQQQDAQELLQVVNSRIVDEATARHKEAAALDSSATRTPFPLEGVLESHIECQTCHFKPAPRRSPFTMLSLTVPQQWSADLDDCFDDLLKQEVIDDYKCDYCRLQSAIETKQHLLRGRISEAVQTQLKSELETLTKALESDPESTDDLSIDFASMKAPTRRITKHNRIADFPSVLAVHLSRSVFNSSTSTKNTCRVAFGEKLRLGGLAEKHMYRLVSVVCHRGSHNSGHYETFRRQANDGASTSPLSSTPDAVSTVGPTAEEAPTSAPVIEVAAQEKSEAVISERTSISSTKSKPARSDRWWGISDSSVRECKTKDVLASKQAVYLLLYEKVLK